VAACTDPECNDQSDVLIDIEWNVFIVSRHIENPPFLVINNSLVLISFDEMTPQNMRAMTVKRYHHQPMKLCKPFVLSEDQSNITLNLLMSITHMNGLSNVCMKTKNRLLPIT
ncbi:hypothetical protein AVEN_117290-1, partial [Araneus ventricosus]